MSRRLAMCASLVALAFAAAAPSASATSTVKKPIQLSLGDSWGAGVGASNPAATGYVPRLYEQLKSGFDCTPNIRLLNACRALELRNISVGGATTPSLIAGQLPQAQALLAERNTNLNPWDDVKVITISIGGNDVFGPVVAACTPTPGPTCGSTIATGLATYQANLASLLSALRAAAGPSTRIVLGTYDNAIVPGGSLNPAGCPIAAAPGGTQLGAAVLEGDPLLGLPGGLHDVMRGVAPAFGVEIAEVFGDLDPAADWVGDCLHPNDTGHQKVADAFADVLVD
jgi:lysophospholipase L1-like esterase